MVGGIVSPAGTQAMDKSTSQTDGKEAPVTGIMWREYWRRSMMARRVFRASTQAVTMRKQERRLNEADPPKAGRFRCYMV